MNSKSQTINLLNAKKFSIYANFTWLAIASLLGILTFLNEESLLQAVYYLIIYSATIIYGVKINSNIFSKCLNSYANNTSYTNLKIISTLFLLTNIGVIFYLDTPGLSTDVNMAKLIVSEHPYLARLYRYGSAVIISMIGISFYKTNVFSEKIKLKKLLYLNCIILMLVGVLYGFKSYMLYPFLPTLGFIAITTKKTKNLIFLLASMLVFLIYYTSIAENISIYESCNFLLDRVSSVQMLGNIIAEENKMVYQNNPQPWADFKQIYSIFDRDYIYLNAQKELFNIYHQRSDLRMELAITSLTEYKLSYGVGGGALLLIAAYLYLTFLKVMATLSSSYILNICIMCIGITSYFDAMLNGQLFYRLVDAASGIVYIYAVILMLSIMAKCLKKYVKFDTIVN